VASRAQSTVILREAQRSRGIHVFRSLVVRKVTMPLFWKPYKSEVSSFIDDLKAKKPTLEAEQRAGRALLWDKHLDRSLLTEYSEAKVPQQPYVYQTRVK